MVTKAEEKRFYKVIYELAFGVEAYFFYTNDSDTVYNYLKERFWGESLEIKINLLCKLLDFDADVNPELKKELRKKSAALKQYFISPPQESTPPS